jgi:hypothetical protein
MAFETAMKPIEATMKAQAVEVVVQTPRSGPTLIVTREPGDLQSSREPTLPGGAP